jgi:dihydrofolate reductase
MKATSERAITVGGPELAARAIRSGLVDEYHVFVVPFVAGGGNNFLPKNVRLQLELVDERRFKSGVIYLHYRTAR